MPEDRPLLIANVGSIEKLHGFVEEAFTGILGPNVHVIASDDRWEKPKSFGGEVFFNATCEGYRRVDLATRMGQPAIELPGFGEGAKAWFTWMEHWLKERGDLDYEMASAGFTFYWGDYKPQEILFRAEWTCDRRDQRVGAAHPHWHFDSELSSGTLTIERLHFGMGGWHSATDSPACWQHWPDDINGLVQWSTRTLEYSTKQLAAYHPTHIPPMHD